jgi:hypothetical protein
MRNIQVGNQSPRSRKSTNKLKERAKCGSSAKNHNTTQNHPGQPKRMVFEEAEILGE